DILSEGVATGAIQVPAHGHPIVLLAGHQATGGYAKIATVIGADLWRLGQARPGDTIRFRLVSLAEAHEALRAYRAAFDPARLAPRRGAAAGAGGGEEEEAPVPPPAPQASGGAEAGDQLTVTAPFLGVFYRSARQGETPLVAPGDLVEPEQPLALIEVMKTFHT